MASNPYNITVAITYCHDWVALGNLTSRSARLVRIINPYLPYPVPSTSEYLIRFSLSRFSRFSISITTLSPPPF